MNDEAVFKSIGQALYTAFSMEFTEPSLKGGTQLMIEDMMEQRYGLPPVPKSERNINLSGMSPDEFRAQCRLMRESVKKTLAAQERDTICARFGYQQTRADAIMALREHFESLCSTRSRDALLALIIGIYMPGMRQYHDETPQQFNLRRTRREQRFSLRSLEREYGVSKSALHRDQQLLSKLCNAIELRAQARMEEVFIKSGLLPDPSKD